MNAENKAAQTVASLAGLFERPERPTAHERIAAHYWGAADEDAVWWFGMASLVSPEPVARHLYLFQCAEDMSGDNACAELTAWCAGMAAECAMSVNSRRRPRIASYRPEWGRQAGKDGAALAMWGEGIRDVLPGVNKRADRFGCRDEAYLRVRDYVQAEAAELIFRFARDVEMAESERFDPDFRERWERATGREWKRD